MPPSKSLVIWMAACSCFGASFLVAQSLLHNAVTENCRHFFFQDSCPDRRQRRCCQQTQRASLFDAVRAGPRGPQRTRDLVESLEMCNEVQHRFPDSLVQTHSVEHFECDLPADAVEVLLRVNCCFLHSGAWNSSVHSFVEHAFLAVYLVLDHAQ